MPLRPNIVSFLLNSLNCFLFFWTVLPGEMLSRLLYFYLPLCIVWAINVLFFGLTVRRIILLQNELKVMLKNESSRHQRKLNKDKEKYVRPVINPNRANPCEFSKTLFAFNSLLIALVF